jgi:prefoldin subunit 5
MTLTHEDLEAIKTIIQPLQTNLRTLQTDISAIKEDIKAMKSDLNLLARLNQLDDIRKEPRLRKLYSTDDQQEA